MASAPPGLCPAHEPVTELYAFGFGLWKHAFVRAFLADLGVRVTFIVHPVEARLRGLGPGVALLIWGRRDNAALRALAARHGLPVWRMEDGFLRSVGLGSDYRVPSSLVLDRRGIYFDPTTSSELEHILETAHFGEEELLRAERLRAAIVESALSKYNFAGGAPLRRPDARTVVLVPGQVEDDASIRCGTRDVRTNFELLRAVRAARPDAYIVYKPHPDVVVGNRQRGQGDHATVAAQVADAVVSDVSLPACLAIADEVHTMTSLVGFEALLRGKAVHCYGLPFYAGWGLTHDRHALPRRTRRLTLEMLIAGTLLRYPRYISQRSWQLTSPEHVVAELREAMAGARPEQRRSPWRRRVRRLHAALRGAFRVRP